LEEDIFLTGTDRDLWFVRKGDKSTSIYAPVGALSGRLDFHGVTQERWNTPYQHEPIAPGDKQQLEQALMAYFTQERIPFVVIVNDPAEPVHQVIRLEG
jgi:hypothetical protein